MSRSCALLLAYVDVVMMLLRRGAMLTINLTDIDGRSALHYAACKASTEMAQVGDLLFFRKKFRGFYLFCICIDRY